MKILHFFKTHWPDTFGGVERVIDNIANELQKKGVESTILSLSKKPSTSKLYYNGYEIIQAKQNFEFASTGFSFTAPFKLIELASKHDVVHYHSPWPFMDICHLLSYVKTPTVLTYHADPIGNIILQKAYTPLLNRFLSSVDKVVATSPNYMDSSPFLKQFNGKTCVIANGIVGDDNIKVPDSQILEIRRKFGNDFFFFVGVLRHYKGIQYLLEAAKATSATILIAGDGKARREFEVYKQTHSLENVHFLGEVKEADKKALLEACLAFVFPSCTRAEAYGLSLAEACRASKPMISCELGTGTSYVNQKDKTGIIIPPKNAKALADAMNHLLNNKLAAKQYGLAARKHYEANLTMEKMVAGYYDIYQDLCQ